MRRRRAASYIDALTRSKSSANRNFCVRGEGQARTPDTYPAVHLAPPPAVGARLGVDLHHVALLQRQLPGVARAEVVARDGHADHLGREHWRGTDGRTRRGEKEGERQVTNTSPLPGFLKESRHKDVRGWGDRGSLTRIERPRY